MCAYEFSRASIVERSGKSVMANYLRLRRVHERRSALLKKRSLSLSDDGQADSTHEAEAALAGEQGSGCEPGDQPPSGGTAEESGASGSIELFGSLGGAARRGP